MNTPFVEQRINIYHSTLHSIKAPLELLHADVADISFSSKSAVNPIYCLLIDKLFTSKTCTYSMKSKNLLKEKLHEFYNYISRKRQENEVMRLQTDHKFQQNKIKNLNSKFNAKMSSSRIRAGNAFTAEQKFHEFKKRLFKSTKVN